MGATLPEKSVLRRSREELIRATDLEEKTIDYVVQLLMTEFDDDELPAEQYGHLPERDTKFYQAARARGGWLRWRELKRRRGVIFRLEVEERREKRVCRNKI